MAPAALHAMTERCGTEQFAATAETGCGGSTIVLSHVSRHHTAFAIEGEHQTISNLREREDLIRERVMFVEGETRNTVPGYRFPEPLDLVLLDGPHAYPMPQIEYAYLFPHLKSGGWLVIDDIQIPSVHELFRFLKMEEYVEFEETVVRTAFFRKKSAEIGPAMGPDGWWLQGINRHLVWRYSWRDRVRKAFDRNIRARS